MLLSFSFRYYVLNYQAPSTNRVKLIIFLVYIPSFLQMALTWQALLPLFYLLAVLSYACGQLGIYNHPLLEHATFILAGFIPTFSPISSLYFVRHYRDRLRWAFFLRRSSILNESNSKEFSTLRDSYSCNRTRILYV
ncbi:hypothetical protein COOONC_18670 [Cooperia oncophora]